MLKSDVVIVTKDRPELLREAVAQVKKLIDFNCVIVVDSSENPDRTLFDVKFLSTPNATLGFARQQGLKVAESEYVIFLDDDIKLAEDWYPKMLEFIEGSDDDVLVVNSRIVFGYKSNPIIQKLHSKSNRDEGGSIGISMLKREQVLALGGFNVHVHRGEDLELYMRLRQHGKRWLCQREAVAYHHCTFKRYIDRAIYDGFGYSIMWKSIDFRLRFVAERFASTWIMPVYYGMLCRDPKVFGVYFLAKIAMLFSFLWNVQN